MKRLSRRLREAQRDRRIPVVSAQVRRGDKVLWADTVHAEADAQLRLGSITKTFTAVLIMQARDAGLLDLDDRVSEHLPIDTPRGVTLRRLLSHGSGVQREPYGDLWSGGSIPGTERLLREFARSEQVLAPGRRFHYSNLAYALLGEVAVRRTGAADWQTLLVDRLLSPLGLMRTTLHPEPPHASGQFVAPYGDDVTIEPNTDLRAAAPAAQLWSTADDLARWGGFLAAPNPDLLAIATVEEMTEVAVMADVQRWSLAYGLGLMIYRRGERLFVGHGGAMPGFLAGLVVDRESATSSAVLTATGVGADAELLACQLLEDALEAEPPKIVAWEPRAAPPAEIEPLLGRWWTEGNEVVFSWHGRLEARLAIAPAWRNPAVFEPLGGDEWRTVSGREAGERLTVSRNDDGTVARMSWATYALTRTPDSFAALNVPGAGIDRRLGGVRRLLEEESP